MRVPETRESELEKVNKLLEEEADEWRKLRMHTNMIEHPEDSLWIMKMQIQTIFDILIKSGLRTEDEVNLTYKKLMLTDMRLMRKQVEEKRRDSIVPEMKLLGPDGEPFKI